MASQYGDRNSGVERTSACGRERGQLGMQYSREGMGLHVGGVVGLRGEDVSSTPGGMSECVGADGCRWH